MVGGIREILGFQADGGILAVRCAILAGGGGLEKVGSIQLHAGLGGQGLHADARFGAGQPCGVAQTAVRNNIAVVIAAALLQGRVIGVDIAANGLSSVKSIGVPATAILRPVGMEPASVSR